MTGTTLPRAVHASAEDPREAETREGVSSLTLPAASAAGSLGEQARVELPNRRMVITTLMRWGGIDWLHKSGFDRAGIVREIFLDPVAPVAGAETPFPLDTELRTLAHDAARTISYLLQRGDRVAALAERLTPAPRVQPSLIQAAAAHAAGVEAQDGPSVTHALDAIDALDKRRDPDRLPSGSGEGA